MFCKLFTEKGIGTPPSPPLYFLPLVSVLPEPSLREIEKVKLVYDKENTVESSKSKGGEGGVTDAFFLEVTAL